MNILEGSLLCVKEAEWSCYQLFSRFLGLAFFFSIKLLFFPIKSLGMQSKIYLLSQFFVIKSSGK